MPESVRPPDATRGEALMRREIGTPLAVFVVINATIGTGIFKTPAGVARLAGSLPAALGVWIAGGAIALCGALSLAELAAAYPRTGGLYEYLRRAYGPTVAFMLGWTKLTLLIPSAVGSFAKLAAEALGAVFGLAPDPRRDAGIAVGFVVVCATANLAGVRASTMQQAVVTAAKYAGVAVLAALGLCAAIPAGATAALPAAAAAAAPPFHAVSTWAGCAAALVSVMWAYDGWADLASLSGEVRRPERALPRALVLGTAAIVVVYLAANAGYARVLGLDGLRRSTTGVNLAAANLATLTLGAGGRRLLSALILVSCLGGCMSSLLTGSRVFVPLASDGLFPRAFGVVSPRTGVPVRAVLISAALGAVYTTVRSFEQLTDAFVVGFFPFYILAVVAVFVLRRREPDAPRPFRVPGYPWVPGVFLAGAAALLVGAVFDVNRTALFAFGVVAAGLLPRWLWARTATRRG
jgi:APA family basic amino acid/polyamine antiporter